jgi:hypothetical protein
MAEMTKKRRGEIALAIVKQQFRESLHKKPITSWYQLPANSDANISVEEAMQFVRDLTTEMAASDA